MTRFIHDQFAKQYLTELLSPLGTVESNKEIAPEVRYIDIFFTPNTSNNSHRERLGLLGEMTRTPALFEPFRNAITRTEMRTCLIKLFTLQGELERQANRQNTPVNEDELPRLWIFTPTASVDFLNSFNASTDEENWGSGIYFCGEGFKAAFIVIHQLPRTPETLWLRVLGRGNVQKQAVEELDNLPENDPLRENILELVQAMIAILEKRQRKAEALNVEEQELIMNLLEMYAEIKAEVREEGKAEGLREGEQQATREFVQTLLRTRFGTVDEQLMARVNTIASLSSEEFTPLLIQLSREEILARFPLD
ncbi:hypothetical protein K4A83_01510 [Spirulina subsalsa FACHB-351]|uniref:Flagellar assembly protein H n=1 Tax=Spirulina subsalsa FACHB-351 TaxID=234711 RepID=A0ABT3L0D8_9CYAN|nr:hypothetical protein [Spirulina subsalsa]MCW6034951.1 hypothetical protein [Spirulina subsalsa FACHB-351]